MSVFSFVHFIIIYLYVVIIYIHYLIKLYPKPLLIEAANNPSMQSKLE